MPATLERNRLKIIDGHYHWQDGLKEKMSQKDQSWWAIPTTCPHCSSDQTEIRETSSGFEGFCNGCEAALELQRTLPPVVHRPKGWKAGYIREMEDGQTMLDIGNVDYAVVTDEGNYAEKCEICRGDGEIWSDAGGGKIECPYCEGSGFCE